MRNPFSFLGICEDLDETRVCTKCILELPKEKYSMASGGNYPRGECHDCATRMRKVRDALKILHPLEDPLNYVCPICKKTYAQAWGRGGKKQKTPWVLDHDHKTEKFRGYLCHDCNRSLGGFSDSPQKLTNAIEYLRQNA